MELKDIVHDKVELSGIDVREIDELRYGYPETQVDVIIDGKAYRFQEDSSDGYRSYHTLIELGDSKDIRNTFYPVEVEAEYVSKGEYSGESDILELSIGDELVLRIGTDNIDDYYPSFVCKFNPEALGEIK